MARPSARRPLPALVFLLILSLLAAVVWWRVSHRASGDTSSGGSSPTCSSTPGPVVLPQPAAVTVRVLNSTQTNGLAGRAATQLRADGFHVAGTANDTANAGQISGVAEIRYGPHGRAAAGLLSYYLPGAVLVADARTGSAVDVSLGAKFTRVAAAAQAHTAMAKAHASQSPAHPPAQHATPASSRTATHSPAKTPSRSTSTHTPTC